MSNPGFTTLASVYLSSRHQATIDGIPNSDRVPLVWNYLRQNFVPDFEEGTTLFTDDYEERQDYIVNVEREIDAYQLAIELGYGRVPVTGARVSAHGRRAWMIQTAES